MTNYAQAAARRERAGKLADVLLVAPDVVRLMSRADWSDAAYTARVTWPITPEERETVALILETRQETPADPFARFDR